jgi:outer membrane protein OmpA-like peptidoglycan-associated protein
LPGYRSRCKIAFNFRGDALKIPRFAKRLLVLLFVVGVTPLAGELLTSGQSLAALSDDERDEVDRILRQSPSVDLSIDFESRSAGISLRSAAFVSLENVGRALSNPDLKKATFLIGGHTALEGNEIYNYELSQRRADAVKRFLVENFDIPAGDLIAVGYGSSKPIEPDFPFSARNQRVQIVNVGGGTAK